MKKSYYCMFNIKFDKPKAIITMALLSENILAGWEPNFLGLLEEFGCMDLKAHKYVFMRHK